MNKEILVLGFAGSLRKGSLNKALLRAAVELAPKRMKLETCDLEGIPPFNQDLELEMPRKVRVQSEDQGSRCDFDRYA